VPAATGTESPYELVLGERLSELHPRLQAYFRGIPSGRRGVGHGTFTRVGTRRRWLWPALWVLARQGVLFPVWASDVQFTVVNRAIRSHDGQVAVAAVRTFHFATGDRSMVDAVTTDRGGLTDYLGHHRRYRAGFTASVSGGTLVMVSTGMSVRLGNRWLAVPRMLAPVVTLTERFDDPTGRQHVEVITTVPGIGTVYEYAGSFEYGIVADSGGVT
jgi:hypothetical protein